MKSIYRFYHLLWAFGSVIVLSGCAAMPISNDFEFHDSASYASPDPGQAVVYFYREKKFSGRGVSYYIRDGEKVIGGLTSGTYFYYVTSPGTAEFCAETEEKICKTLQLEADKIYYVKGEVDFGMWIGRPELTIVSDLEGKATVPNLRYATLLSDAEKDAKEAAEGGSYFE